MKKFLFALVALVFVGQANADVLRRDVRLQVKVAPYGNLAGGITKTLKVFRNGEVSLTQCQAVHPRPCRTRRVELLNAYQMDRIERLVEAARFGRIMTYRGPVCMALPTQMLNYSADNGRVFLKSGARPCGSPTFNASKAGEELVRLLDRLLVKAN